jgi:putative copper resistance protein D
VPGDALQLALFAFRAALNVSILLLIGLALHAALGVVEREAMRRWRGLIIGLVLAATTLAFARLLVLNVQMGDATTLLDPDLLALGWMALGPSSLAFAIGVVAIVVGLLFSQRLILVVAASVTAAGFALTGHAQALPDPGLAPYGVGLHAAIAGFWVAAPLTLAPDPAVADDVMLARLKRFSAAAVVLIPVLFIAGLWLAWVLADGIDGLIMTAYGQLLLLKLAAATITLGIGALNRQVVTAKVATDAPTGRRWLRRTLTVESVLFAVAILAVSAATTLTGAGEGLPAQ